MTFDLTRLRRYPSECLPGEEMSPQDIKDLKDGVPNYPMVEIQGPDPSLENMCCECTGSGVMMGNYPCKPCGGTGYIVPEPIPEIIGEVREMTMEEIKELANVSEFIQYNWNKINKMIANAVYPNERELALLNSRISKLKVQLSKELSLKKSERNQFEVKQLQQSINQLTKWKLPNKNSMQIAS